MVENLHDRDWGMEDEKNYLRNIGTHTTYKTTKTQIELLTSYLECLNNRVKWGKLNKAELIKFIVEHIMVLNSKVALP